MTLAHLSDGVRNELLAMFHERALAAREARINDLLSLRLELDQGAKHPAGVEIGAHRAAFLVGVARSHAPRPVLGIEVREKYVRLGRERLEKHGQDNAAMLHADARLAIPILLPPNSVEAFYVTFPDPWWKARHHNRRVLDPLFMRVLARRLRPGGRLYLKSDVFEYLHRVRFMAESSHAFRPLPAERWPDERDWTWTIRERKCMNTAVPFGRGYYERLASFPHDLPSEVEDAEVFAIDEDIDPVSVIRGAPPADIAARLRRGKGPGTSNDG